MNEEPSIKLAKSLLKEGNKSQAIQVLGKLVQLNPNNELAWLWLAHCMDDAGKKRFCLQKALSVESESKPVQPVQASKVASSHISTTIHSPKTKKPVSWVTFGIISFLCIIIVGATILGLAYLPSGLASLFPAPIACNKQLLNKTLSVVPVPPRTDTLKAWSEGMFLALGVKEGTLSWTIEPRNEYGCVVTLSGDKNGVRTADYAWFVDLDQKKVFADSDYARAIVKGWVTATGDIDLLNGFPLP